METNARLRGYKRIASALVIVFSTIPPAGAGAVSCDAGLRSPFPVAAPAPNLQPKPFQCRAVPAPVVSLDVQSKYDQTVETRDVLDQASAARFTEAVADMRAYRTMLVKAANVAATDTARAASAAHCAAGYLTEWASAEALTQMETPSAYLQRSSYLTGIALAWLQIRDQIQTPETSALVKAWIGALANDTIAYFDSRRDKPSGQNNHIYWAGLAVALSGVVADDCDFYNWGVEKLYFALNQIDDTGLLPLETARGARAREYNMYALGPLSFLALLEKMQGRDIRDENNGAFGRYVHTVLESITDPAFIADLAGAAQNEFKGQNGAPKPHQVAWLEILYQFDNAMVSDIDLASFRPLSFSSLGGNLTRLFGQNVGRE